MQSITHMDSWWCEALFEHHPTAMAVVGPDRHFVRCNAAFCALTGYATSELQRRSWQSITHPDDVSGNQSGADAAQLSPASSHYTIDKRYIRKNGNSVWVTLHVRSVRDDHGTFLFYVVVATPLHTDAPPVNRARPKSLVEWARENPRDALVVAIGASLFLGRDAVIEILKGLLSR